MNTDADRRPTNDDCHADANGTAGGHSGPTSQIPGLSHGATDGPEERARGGRRVGVMDSDSVYVKLAKQGGQKGLLWHEETNLGTKPNAPNAAYHAPDWFSADSAENHEQPSPTESEKALRTREAAPFGSDNKSTWERQADDDKQKLGDAASSQMKKLSVSEEDQQDACKYKKTSHNKKPDPVSMSKLLGFGYAKDEKETSN